MEKTQKALIEEALKNLKVTYTVETVYSCIKKGDTLEIEDNREQIKERWNKQKKLQ